MQGNNQNSQKNNQKNSQGNNQNNYLELDNVARKLRRHVVEMTCAAGSGHPGGSLSAADIITALYFEIMNVKPKNPKWVNRDRLVLSKGHAAPVLYAALAEKGYFPVSELITLRKLGSRLQGHPDMRTTKGVDASTGSLGQGLSIANGMALAGRLNKKDYWVYVVLGDGESQEGQVWEAAMASAHYNLDKVIAFLDYNRLQIDGKVGDIMELEPVAEKWKAFGWEVCEADGHNIGKIIECVERMKKIKGKPHMIICHTTKGKGISFMENKAEWHGKAPDTEQLCLAVTELD